MNLKNKGNESIISQAGYYKKQLYNLVYDAKGCKYRPYKTLYGAGQIKKRNFFI
jgi:hypothetical protein